VLLLYELLHTPYTDVWQFRSANTHAIVKGGLVEVFDCLGCYVEYVGTCVLTFRDCLSAPSSRAEDCLTLDPEGRRHYIHCSGILKSHGISVDEILSMEIARSWYVRLTCFMAVHRDLLLYVCSYSTAGCVASGSRINTE